MGLGIALLANSRPFEGLVACIPTATYLLWWILGKIKTKDDLRIRVAQVLIPLLAAMVLLVSFMAYYNWRLTGNALMMPHVLNTQTYESARYFLWQGLKPTLHYRNAQFEGFYNGWSRNYYNKSWGEALRLTKDKAIMLATYFFGRPEWLLLPFLPFALRDRKMRFLVITLLIGGVGVFLTIWGHPHYAAPLVCVVYGLLVQAMRHLNTIEVQGRRLGTLALRVIVVVLFTVVLDRALAQKRDVDDRRTPQIKERAELIAELNSTPGKHLVMVRYHKNHDYHMEWVYNGAEIDSAKILWARELDAAQNERLLEYFKDRQVWLFQPDEMDKRIQQLKPYPRTAAQPIQQASMLTP